MAHRRIPSTLGFALPYTAFTLALLLVVSCGGSTPTTPSTATGTLTTPAATVPAAPAAPAPATPSGWDATTRGIPAFIAASYIDLDAIGRITYFRSSHGHSYTDSVETCRSMKHYFIPRDYSQADRIRIYAPATGTIRRVDQEWAGAQLRIEPDGYPDFLIILFHVNLNAGLGEGSRVESGQQIGTHIGSQTSSDIALSVNTPSGFVLVSPFEAMTDAAFAPFRSRGLGSPADAIITRERRDAAPLTCSGEAFAGGDSLPVFTAFR